MGCNASSIDQSSTVNDWSKYVVKCIIDFLNAHYSIVIAKIDASLLLMCISNYIVPIDEQFPKASNIITKQAYLIGESNQEGPNLDKCQKDYPINLNKLIWTYPLCLGVWVIFFTSKVRQYLTSYFD